MQNPQPTPSPKNDPHKLLVQYGLEEPRQNIKKIRTSSFKVKSRIPVTESVALPPDVKAKPHGHHSATTLP
jgi:hypothetical protein